ncbi:MAG: H-NS histone family protein [Rhodoferax sp.]|nr:H-NS histone family protein [Rhodoferax sp.]
MGNLIEIQSQIEKLQRQANEIKAKEFDKTVQEIIVKMKAFGITPKNLQSAGDGNAKSKAKLLVKSTRKKSHMAGTTTVAAKYRGPNGETWSGRGLTPRWLASLIAQGNNKEEFVIKN